MIPTAVSQILEQIVNAIVSVVAAGLLFHVGEGMNAAQGAKNYSYALGAAGGTIGTGAGALTAFIFFIFLTAKSGRSVLKQRIATEELSEEAAKYARRKRTRYRKLIYALTITVLPIVVSSGIYNCSNVVDNFLFGQGMDKLGYSGEEIAVFWGALGQYQLLFNIPVAVSNALSSSLIPSLTRAVSAGDREQTLKRIAAAVRFSMLISIPAAVGIAVLADPVCNLLFISEDNSLLIKLTMAGSLAVVFFSLSTVTNAVLQGLNRMEVPVRHAAVSLVIHVVLWVLLMVFHMGIYGVVFANIVFAFVMCVLNARTIAKHARYRQEYKKTFVLPAISACVMGGAAWGVVGSCLYPFRQRPEDVLESAIVVFPAVAVAAAVYAVLLVGLKAIDEEELRDMPMGTKMIRILKKVRLL